MAKKNDDQLRVDEEKYVGFSVACNNDEANACHSLGEWYAVLRGNFSKAGELFLPNCTDRKYGNSCFSMGLLYGEPWRALVAPRRPQYAVASSCAAASTTFAATGRGAERSKPKSLAMFERACELGNGDGCDLAGRTLMEEAAKLEKGGDDAAAVVAASSGHGTAASMRERAVELLERGCGPLESATACKFLGEVFLVGRFGHAADKPRAAKYLETACEQFEMTACRNLMVMHSRGDGVPKDFDKAEEYRRRSVEAVEAESGVKMPEYLQDRYKQQQTDARAGGPGSR